MKLHVAHPKGSEIEPVVQMRMCEVDQSIKVQCSLDGESWCSVLSFELSQYTPTSTKITMSRYKVPAHLFFTNKDQYIATSAERVVMSVPRGEK
jgi:hypothetical protein